MESFELTLEQERYLKKILFEMVFDGELTTVHQHPTVQQVTTNTLLLKQLYQFLMDFPLFGPAEHQKFKAILTQVIHNLPQLSSTSTGATKRDFKLQLRSLLVHCSMFLFVGPKEKKHYQNAQEPPSPTPSPPPTPQGAASPPNPHQSHPHSHPHIHYHHNQPVYDHHHHYLHHPHPPQQPPSNPYVHYYDPQCEEAPKPPKNTTQRRGKKVFDTLQRILLQYQSTHPSNVTGALFDVLRNTSNMNALPSIFKELMAFMREDATEWTFEKMCINEDDTKDQKNLSKLKRIHTLLPQTIILGILKIANPFALASGFVNLCVARPFGVKNLMQRIMESLIRLNDTEHDIERVKKQLSHRRKIVKKLSAYFSKHSKHTSLVQFVASIHQDSPKAPMGSEPTVAPKLTADQMRRIGEIITGVLQNMDFKPRLKPHHFAALTDPDYYLMWRWFELESKRQAKTMFIDFIGSDIAIGVFKDLIPILYMPLMSLYDAHDLEMLVKATFQLMEGCIKVAEAGKHHHIHPQQQLYGYGDLFDHFSSTVYAFVHHVANVDQNQGGRKLELLVKWSLQLYTFNRKGGLSVEDIVKAMPPSKREAVVSELQSVIDHREKRKELKVNIKDCKLSGSANQVTQPGGITKIKALEEELKNLQPPVMTAIPELLPGFTDAIQNHFKQAGIAQH